jgi:hypothetical protein
MRSKLLCLAVAVAVLSLAAGAADAQPGPVRGRESNAPPWAGPAVPGGLRDLGDPRVIDRERFPSGRPGKPGIPDRPQFVDFQREVKQVPLEPVHLSPSVVADVKLSKPEPPWWLRFLPHAIIAILGAGGAGAGAASRVRSEER